MRFAFPVDFGLTVGVIMWGSKVNRMLIETMNAAAVEGVTPTRAPDRQLEEALERVFQKYGSDLSAFLKDVTDEVATKQHVKMVSSYPMRVRR